MQSLFRSSLSTTARRSFSTTPVVAARTTSPSLRFTKPGALRPHAGIPVKADHGLYGFFRQRVFKEDEPGFGTVEYETLEAHAQERPSGRSWAAAELRRKSFEDLHTLWYVLLRERNLLYTSEEEARREGIDSGRRLRWEMMHSCRKSMARIKFVLNERRVAYQGAVILDSGFAEAMMEPIQRKLTLASPPMRARAPPPVREKPRKDANRAKQPENPTHGGRPALPPRHINPDGSNAKKPKYTAEQKEARRAQRATDAAVSEQTRRHS